ncbi:hypothetical protein Tco_1186492 [Tanacetum coccineum]
MGSVPGQMGVLWIRRIDLVSFMVFCEVQAQIRHIFLDGYGVLDVRTGVKPWMHRVIVFEIWLSFMGINDRTLTLRFMESSNNLNKGNGIVGSIGKDAMDVQMMRLKGQDHSSSSMSQDKVNGFNVATGVTSSLFPTLAEVMGSQSKRVSNKPGATSMKLRSGKFTGSLPASAATTLGESRVTDVLQNILMNDQGVGAVSTHNHIVGGLNSNRELSHEAFNTMPSVEVCEVVMDTVYAMWQALLNVNDTMTNEASPSKVTPSDLIVQYVDINTKSTSYVEVAGASTKDQPKVNSNFRLLVADLVFDGVNISIPRKVVKKAKNELKRIMMNAKGFFFFKFDTRAGLEADLEEVKLHDVPIQVFEEDGISLIAMFIKVALVDVITIGIPSLTVEGFTKETIRVEYEWRPPRCDTCKIFGHTIDGCPKKAVVNPRVNLTNDGVQHAGTKGSITPSGVTSNSEQTNDGFQIMGKEKMKGKSKFTNCGQCGGHSVKQTVRYEPKANTIVPKK